mmetsp:Transcript_23524/g.56092  ORF Transcript_23524/g.56092 Transcript_23524/m.56092 type:complete len:253 (+) Transcript_23524:3232-3990(+)
MPQPRHARPRRQRDARRRGGRVGGEHGVDLGEHGAAGLRVVAPRRPPPPPPARAARLPPGGGGAGGGCGGAAVAAGGAGAADDRDAPPHRRDANRRDHPARRRPLPLHPRLPRHPPTPRPHRHHRLGQPGADQAGQVRHGLARHPPLDAQQLARRPLRPRPCHAPRATHLRTVAERQSVVWEQRRGAVAAAGGVVGAHRVDRGRGLRGDQGRDLPQLLPRRRHGPPRGRRGARARWRSRSRWRSRREEERGR